MERLGNEIERELARSGAPELAAISRIVALWPQAVGDAVARNAWPLRVARDGTLHVATTSATWAFELDRLASEIAERLGALLGDESPSALRFRPGPVPEPATAAPASAGGGPSAVPPAPPEVVHEAASVASRIEDADLREVVERAARASLARARSGRVI
jgi:hypothetical protein